MYSVPYTLIVFILNTANFKRFRKILQGLQHKKDTFDDYLDYAINPFDYEKRSTDFQDVESGSESFKRARMGFHGMRGKRDATGIYGSNSSTVGTIFGYQGTYINLVIVKMFMIK